MKRQLISYDIFESLQNESLSNVERELVEAENILARTLQVEGLHMISFTNDKVVYAQPNGNLLHANYKVESNSNIEFSNIVELEIDKETEVQKEKSIIGEMVDSIIEGNKEKADSLFKSFIEIPSTMRKIRESVAAKAYVSTGKGKDSKFKGKKRAGGIAAAAKAARTRKKNARLTTLADKMKIDRLKKIAKEKLGGKKLSTGKGEKNVRTFIRLKKKVNEWVNLYENAFEFVDFTNYSGSINESQIARDARGNVVALRMPTTFARNEAKVLTANWKTLNTDLKVMRGTAHQLSENSDFCKAVAKLKEANGFSDQKSLEESLEKIVGSWPHVLYLTQEELSKSIKEALEVAHSQNYDDSTCDFMAEGILRTAHSAYADRAKKIMTIAGVKVDENSKDAYEDFKRTAELFYPTLDESVVSERKLYVDLYNALREVYEMATEVESKELMDETANHLSALASVLRQEIDPSSDIVEAAANWLSTIVEGNLEDCDYEYSNEPHISINGENPVLGKKASSSYTPSKDFAGDWSDVAPVSDGESHNNKLADEMRNNAWGNQGGKQVWPDLSNPLQPEAGDFTLKDKEEKGVDKTSDSDSNGQWQSNDTWPNLQNPYLPKSLIPKANV